MDVEQQEGVEIEIEILPPEAGQEEDTVDAVAVFKVCSKCCSKNEYHTLS